MSRICYITNLYPPIQTGTSYYVDQLSRSMLERGHQVTVITCGDSRTPEEEDRRGVHVLRLPSVKLPQTRLLLGFDSFRLALTPANVRAACEIVNARGVEIIQTCGHLLDLTYLGAIVAHRTETPAACSIHTMIHHPSNRLINAALRGVDWTIHARLAMRRYHCLLTLDKLMERYAREVYRGVETIPVMWGIPFDFDLDVRRPAHAGGPLRILSVGHVTAMRSRRALIDAVGILVQAGVPCRLRIVGKLCTQEPVERVRRAGLQSYVEFVGELPREQVLDEFRKCDVHGVWISNPGVGSAGSESMCAGVPTLLWADADQLGVVRLRHMENCVLIDPRRPDTIAAALRQLWEDPALRDRIGTNARTFAREHFSWPTIARQMEGVYRRVIGESVARRCIIRGTVV
jgi:glycosyltransferase involved in cell wall biosynthesis